MRRPRGIKLAEMRGGSRQIGMLEKSLRAAIERRRPDLVVLDPYVKLHALEENDNGAMDFVCDLLATLAIEYDIAIDAPHHTKKGQLTPGMPISVAARAQPGTPDGSLHARNNE